MSEKIKKKRGRKPKDTIIINKNPVFADDNESIDDLIIKLNHNNYNNSENDILFNIDDIDNKNLVHSNISEVCWNCCHNFNNNIVVGLPYKYTNNIFYSVGDFCSLECAARYAFDNYKNNIYEIMNIINLYKNIKYNSSEKVKLALPRLTLKKFGGNLSIDEYRKNIDNTYNIITPITIPVNMKIDKYENNNNNNSNLVLYRKNKNKNNIFDKLI